MTGQLALRLPPGWTVLPGTPEGVLAASGPQLLLTGGPQARPRVCRAAWPDGPDELGARAGAVLAHLLLAGREVQLLDEQRTGLRDGRRAHAVLTASRTADGLPCTTETLVTRAEVLSASAPTPLWPALADRLGRLLRSCGGAHPPPREAEQQPFVLDAPDAGLDVEIAGAVHRLCRAGGVVQWQGAQLPTALLAHWLAAAAGLGPRPTASAPGLLLAERTALERFLAGERGALDVPAGPWREPLVRLAEAGGRRLRVGALELVDGGEAGWWLVLPGLEPGEVALRPVTPAHVWSRLVLACAA